MRRRDNLTRTARRALRGLLAAPLIGMAWGWPMSRLAAQVSNGAVTVTHETIASGGGVVGGGNPLRAVTVLGVPIGGVAANGTVTMRSGYPASQGDTTPPVIAASQVGPITDSSAVITWTTDEPATSQVEYGLTPAYGSWSAVDVTLVTVHTVPLSGLAPATLYHARIHSVDGAGNGAVSADLTWTTLLSDTTPPSGTVAINGGAPTTNAVTVTLTLSASDDRGVVAMMRFSNDGITFTAAEPYTATRSWTVPAGDGTKTVTVQFADAAGNWSAPVSATIVLDTTPPVVAITAPQPGAVIGAP